MVSFSSKNGLAVAAQKICNAGGELAEDAVFRVPVTAEFGGGWVYLFESVGEGELLRATVGSGLEIARGVEAVY